MQEGVWCTEKTNRKRYIEPLSSPTPSPYSYVNETPTLSIMPTIVCSITITITPNLILR